jgi:hypothetical protein
LSPLPLTADAEGRRVDDKTLEGSCIGQAPTRTASQHLTWVLLRAAQPGTYRIAAPYSLPRGTPCPS